MYDDGAVVTVITVTVYMYIYMSILVYLLPSEKV